MFQLQEMNAPPYGSYTAWYHSRPSKPKPKPSRESVIDFFQPRRCFLVWLVGCARRYRRLGGRWRLPQPQEADRLHDGDDGYLPYPRENRPVGDLTHHHSHDC